MMVVVATIVVTVVGMKCVLHLLSCARSLGAGVLVCAFLLNFLFAAGHKYTERADRFNC